MTYRSIANSRAPGTSSSSTKLLGAAVLCLAVASIPGCDESGTIAPEPSSADLDKLVCPTGLSGPALVRIQTPEAVYCMDQREVTWSEYKAFLGSQPSTVAQPPECSWNKTFEPEYYGDGIEVDPTYRCAWHEQPTSDDTPANCLDFCDAHAYCAWAGKRLCGRIGGPTKWGVVNMSPSTADMNAVGELAKTTEMEFTNACTQAGTTTFAYGNTYQPGTCIDAEWVAQKGENSLAVTDLTNRSCHGMAAPFDKLYDLSGSINEWQNLCRLNPNGSCLSIGSSWATADPAYSTCTGSVGFANMKEKGVDLGFRCCADGVP